jgi:hypothetical protein
MSLAHMIADVFTDTPLPGTSWRWPKTGWRSATTRCIAYDSHLHLCTQVLEAGREA